MLYSIISVIIFILMFSPLLDIISVKILMKKKYKDMPCFTGKFGNLKRFNGEDNKKNGEKKE